MVNVANQQFRILKLKQVVEMTSLSRSTIYDRMGKGTFPSSVNLGARAVGWLESEINDWIVDCLRNRKINVDGSCTN